MQASNLAAAALTVTGTAVMRRSGWIGLAVALGWTLASVALDTRNQRNIRAATGIGAALLGAVVLLKGDRRR